MKLGLAIDDEGVSEHQFLSYYDSNWINNYWNKAKEDYKHTKVIKSMGGYAILETSSLKELVKFEDQFNVVRVEENEHNTQVPYTLVML